MSTEGNNSLLVEPKAKKNPNFPVRYPYPIVCDTSKENVGWNTIIGHLKNNCVEVMDEADIETIFSMGFFGKGTRSRSTPQVLENKLKESAGGNKKKRSWSKSKQKHKNNEDESAAKHLDSDKETEKEENPAKRLKEDEGEDDNDVIISDSDDSVDEDNDSSRDSICVTAEMDEKETLQLSLEEAYFLSYGLGVLVVKDRDQPLDLRRLWHKFCEIHDSQNFPVIYTAYHHFRSKGWIVRSGTKYGTDFALYKDGPPFYHSSYAVIVKPVKEQNFRDINIGGRPNLTWSSLAGLNRMCNHVSKAVIILYVIKPASISENKISTPYCISQYRLEEVLVNRWVPSSDRCEE